MQRIIFLIVMVLILQCAVAHRLRISPQKASHIVAFVKTDVSGQEAFDENECKVLASWDNLYIASIPTNRLKNLKEHRNILRIEASEPYNICLDTTATLIHTDKVWEGVKTPQAYTGRDVVVGIQDIGFDLTHPTFGGNRIKAFWDMLSKDTIGSTMPVGRAFEDTELDTVAHSYDGLQQTHGTHTAGIAVGNGNDSQYKGMAWESDIVLVANACKSNISLIDSADLAKYTTAMDVLGFKYIFDYAERQGKPCVISYSEGGPQDLYDGSLLYEALEKLSGPGRIIMASAGNSGEEYAIAKKSSPTSNELKSKIKSWSNKYVMFDVCTKNRLDIGLKICGQEVSYPCERIKIAPDSTLHDTIQGKSVVLTYYPSTFNPEEDVYEIMCDTSEIDFNILSDDPDIMAYGVIGMFVGKDAQKCGTINSPASAPSVIAVGSCSYRQGIKNDSGKWMTFDYGTNGIHTTTSSLGPTITGVTKPEVLAPGVNIISAYNSYYLDNHPEDKDWEVATFIQDGRTFSWNANSGTSMSCPLAAGIIALWLQAKPTLTKEEILDVFAHSCRHFDESLDYPNNQYGYGEIDAYKGLLYILGISSIVSHHQIDSSVFPLQQGESMTIYTIDGRQVDEITAPGVYAIQIKSPNPSRNGSMLIRK